MSDRPAFHPTRRIVFHGLGAIGVAAALAGCGGGSSEPAAREATAGAELATTSEIPVGGGLILTDQQIVITQPTEGEFKAFTAVCPHEGNTVTSVESGTIECSFHGSSFSAETGEVEGGPAGSALAVVAIDVQGDKILAA
ncbi:iron-sulfur protein [Nocardioides psychrotolerans]|uniref:Ferredoxin subunit of nitrite reductase or a ring-hydroxylating dioxygenase n=1 Tax=Nocardioides psychrotolerans TaxID=1005945 RepID=A0A1I3J951_9ACTN|nr:Rieske (2Fe-2S) protein [Nocardioides psychrotolerans]GEP38236.1 iron-sulfur protein [Nocardioides psychrotolerans]SFI56616.1 Ferredoxin subunit of nitrite reductase or a ring-hydroxylating dioxygenase [Nocardioides psychrotolerans]